MAIKGYIGVDGVARSISNGYVGVDGVARSISKGYVGVDGIAREFGEPEPWQRALQIVGISKDSLHAVLISTSTCNAMANNSAAMAIMRDNYEDEMTSYIDSNFTPGLNLLNYKSGFKCYLFNNGDKCSDITGGWGTVNKGYVSSTELGINSGSSSQSMVYTNNIINGAYYKLYFKITRNTNEVKFGIAGTKGTDSWIAHYYTYSSPTGNHSIGFVAGGYPQFRIGADNKEHSAAVSQVWLEPAKPTGTSWMSSSNGHSSPYAYTANKYAGVGVTRTYWFHVSSITGGTLQAGVKHGTWENDFTSKINVTKTGWHSFTHALGSSQDAYTRFAIKMSDGGSASATSTTLTVSSSSGTATVDEVLVS